MIARFCLGLVLALALAGCDQTPSKPPAPVEITSEAIGHYCGMLLVEHDGPKGQALVQGRDAPYWFSSARDALIFVRLPEEPRDIRAVYVTDMAKAKSWERPEPGAWIEAREAWFVIDSNRRGGMGGLEAVPFSQEKAAQDFVARYGGRVVRFAEVPEAYLFDPGPPGEIPANTETEGHAGH